MNSIYFDSLRNKVKKAVQRGRFISVDGKKMDGELIMCHFRTLIDINGYGEEIRAILRNDYFAMQRLKIDTSHPGYTYYQRVEYILKEKICRMIDRIDVRCSNVLVNIAKSYNIDMPKWLTDKHYGVNLGENGWELYKL